jgi:hypothetical protein
LPPELLGCHVGGPIAHTTGRTTTLAMRLATAFFGHLGIEWVGHPVRLAGLDPDRRYRIEVIDDLGSCPRAGRTRPAWLDEPVVASGRHLAELGLQPPVMHPESVLLVHLSSAEPHPPE